MSDIEVRKRAAYPGKKFARYFARVKGGQFIEITAKKYKSLVRHGATEV